ncbi:MAG: hypothetical protein WCT48_07415 [Candidatus Paceibacterota bacterium]
MIFTNVPERGTTACERGPAIGRWQPRTGDEENATQKFFALHAVCARLIFFLKNDTLKTGFLFNTKGG